MKQFKFLPITLALTLWTSSFYASAAALYAAEPPANSAYVRVIHLGAGTADVLVDGKLRQAHLGSGQAGDYLVLPFGSHHLTVQSNTPSHPSVSAELGIESGQAVTVAFAALQANAKPMIFADKSSSNKSKAMLAVYHLASSVPSIEVTTADGKTKVFRNLTYASTQQLAVNPLSVELLASPLNVTTTAAARCKLEMSAGTSYSIILLSGENGQLLARTVQNKVEPYTGK